MYGHMFNAEKGILTVTREAMKAVQEKKAVEVEMERIKIVVGALSPTFP